MGWARNQGLDRMTNAGHVKGISDVTQGKGARREAVRPRVRGVGTHRGRAGVGRQQERRRGRVSTTRPPGLRANVTVNTDFAQTEVDQRQVNLTRFSLFFPERRDFFLDGATFFDFASTNGNGLGSEQVQPFFSRRSG
jgi:hypothetical protein